MNQTTRSSATRSTLRGRPFDEGPPLSRPTARTPVATARRAPLPSRSVLAASSGVLIAGALGALTPAAAVAARPGAAELAGNTITCGTEVLTFTAGVQSGDLRRVQLGNGRQVVLVDVRLHGAVLTDTAGFTYRAVGGANSIALVQDEGDPNSLAGRFNVTIVVLGDQGRAGTVLLRERTASDGTVTTVTSGGCAL